METGEIRVLIDRRRAGKNWRNWRRQEGSEVRKCSTAKVDRYQKEFRGRKNVGGRCAARRLCDEQKCWGPGTSHILQWIRTVEVAIQCQL